MCSRSARLIALILVSCSWCARVEGGVCVCNADVDNDGDVDILDAVCIEECKGGNCSCCVNSCDVNCDGVVGEADVGSDPLNTDSMWRCQFIGIAASACCGGCCDTLAGSCVDDIWQSNCTGANDAWTQGLRCSVIACDPDPTGACCDLDFGTCDNGIAQAACTGANILWTDGQACSPSTCPPPPTGACCNLGNGLCVDDVVQANCAAGRVWTQDTACVVAGCAVPPQDPCTCNSDVDGVAGVDINDVLRTAECALDDCSGCVNSCDIDCNGVVDLVDMGVAACEFRGQSNCCDELSGACVGAIGSLPSCFVTTLDGCELFEGAYLGDGTVCETGVPAASTWGLAVLTLLLATFATLLLIVRRGRQGATVA